MFASFWRLHSDVSALASPTQAARSIRKLSPQAAALARPCLDLAVDHGPEMDRAIILFPQADMVHRAVVQINEDAL